MKEHIIRLSICIPTYNRSREVCRQLAFIAEEVKTRDEVQIIVSNNASQDDTKECLIKMRNDYKFIYLENEKNIGVVKNIARLIAEAEGEFIWLVGDDDYILPGTVDRVIALLNENDDLSGIFINKSRKPELLSIPQGEKARRSCIRLLPILSGDLLFMTSNVIRTESIKYAMSKIDTEDAESMSMSILFPFIAAANEKYRLQVISEPCIENDVKNISWSNVRYKVLVRYNAQIFMKLQQFGYSKKECDNLIKAYFVRENRRIFLEIVKHLKIDVMEAFSDLCWYLKKFPFLTMYLLISLPIRSLYYLCIVKEKKWKRNQ